MNNQTVKIFLENESLIIVGALTFYTVQTIWEKSQLLLKNLKSFSINLAKVTHCDSAGLALLIEWKRMALSENKNITFQYIPQQMINIAEVSHLDQILSL